MLADFIVHFKKDEKYRRFNLTGILTRYARDVITVDLYEETTPLMTKFTVREGGENETEYEHGDIINYIHASLVIAPEDLPNIITNLQQLYETYQEENSIKQSESGE